MQDLSLFIEKTEVQLPKGSLAVRGLNLTDITGLAERHKAEITKAFDEVAGNQDEVIGSPVKAASKLLTDFPLITADILALALDADIKQVAKLPTGVQVLLLEKIVALTFEIDGGMGKVFEIVTNAIGSVTSLLPARDVPPAA